MQPSSQPIWHSHYTPEQINQRFTNTLAQHLNIRFIEVGPDFLKAEMPVTSAVHQPMGLLHGGASVALAETIGSVAAGMMIDREGFVAVGQEINANHIRSVRSGVVTATASPVHVGRTSQVWEIRIVEEQNKLVCISRLTMAVIPRPG